MSTIALARSIQGVVLDLGEATYGSPVRSNRGEAGDVLAERLRDDGYLFLPGFFDERAVHAAQGLMAQRLAAAQRLHPGHAAAELVARPGLTQNGLDGLTDDHPQLDESLYGPSTLAFFAGLFGGPARHFDFTWSRAFGPGPGTAAHCDVVFMGRGTPDVVTMWTAWCDIPVQVGGLAILHGSHRDHESLRSYRHFDVDTYCENLGESPVASLGTGGSLPCVDANELRERLGSRWLFTDYRAGDVIVFGMGTVHASLDNASPMLRLSTDTRYQLASAPVDERWVGPEPIGHSLAAQRGTIC